MSCGPSLDRQERGAVWCDRLSPSARSSQPVVARRHSDEKITCEAMRNSGSSTTVALSASSTTRKPRSRAASQIGRTNCGYRLSARTRSAAATRPLRIGRRHRAMRPSR